MGDMTTYLKNKLRDHVLRNTAYASPPDLFLRLYTDATDDDGGGTEVAGGSYVGQPVTFDATATPGGSENDAPVSFVNMPAATVTHAALHDDDVAGNMLKHKALAAPKTVEAGDTLTFA